MTVQADFSVKLEGFDTLKARTEALPQKLQRNILRGGMRAAVGVIRKLAREFVPVRTGKLRRSIRASARSFRDGRLVGTVTSGGKGAWQANIIEVGAKPHKIRARRGKALSIGRGGYVKQVDHPGHRAYRYMERAATQGEKPAADAFSNYVQTRVSRYMSTGVDA